MTEKDDSFSSAGSEKGREAFAAYEKQTEPLLTVDDFQQAVKAANVKGFPNLRIHSNTHADTVTIEATYGMAVTVNRMYMEGTKIYIHWTTVLTSGAFFCLGYSEKLVVSRAKFNQLNGFVVRETIDDQRGV